MQWSNGSISISQQQKQQQQPGVQSISCRPAFVPVAALSTNSSGRLLSKEKSISPIRRNQSSISRVQRNTDVDGDYPNGRGNEQNERSPGTSYRYPNRILEEQNMKKDGTPVHNIFGFPPETTLYPVSENEQEFVEDDSFAEDPPLIRPPANFSLFCDQLLKKGESLEHENVHLMKKFTTPPRMSDETEVEMDKKSIRSSHVCASNSLVPRIALSAVAPNLPSADRRAIPDQDIESDSSEISETQDEDIVEENLMVDEEPNLIPIQHIEGRKTMNNNPVIHHSINKQQHRASYPIESQIPLSFRTPRIVGIQSQPSVEIPGISLITPRTATRLRGPFSIVDGGVLERLEDGTGRITPRPEHFDLNTVQLSTIREQRLSMKQNENESTAVQQSHQQEPKDEQNTQQRIDRPITDLPQSDSSVLQIDSSIIDDYLPVHQSKRMSTLHEEQEECNESEGTPPNEIEIQKDDINNLLISKSEIQTERQNPDCISPTQQLSYHSEDFRRVSRSTSSRKKNSVSSVSHCPSPRDDGSVSHRSINRRKRFTNSQQCIDRMSVGTEDLPPLFLPGSGSSFYYGDDFDYSSYGYSKELEYQDIQDDNSSERKLPIYSNDANERNDSKSDRPDQSPKFLRSVPPVLEFGRKQQQSSGFAEVSCGNQPNIEESFMRQVNETTNLVQQSITHNQDIHSIVTPPRRHQTLGTSFSHGLLKRVSPSKRYIEYSDQEIVKDSIHEAFAFSPYDESPIQHHLPRNRNTLPSSEQLHHKKEYHRGKRRDPVPFESPRFGTLNDETRASEDRSSTISSSKRARELATYDVADDASANIRPSISKNKNQRESLANAFVSIQHEHGVSVISKIQSALHNVDLNEEEKVNTEIKQDHPGVSRDSQTPQDSTMGGPMQTEAESIEENSANGVMMDEDDAIMMNNGEGMDWETFQELFYGGEFSRSKFMLPCPTLQEIIESAIKEADDQNEGEIDADEKEWTLDDVFTSCNIETLVEYYSKKIEESRIRINFNSGMTTRKKKREIMLPSRDLEKPAVVEVFESFMPKENGTAESIKKLEHVHETCWKATTQRCEREALIEVLTEVVGQWEKRFENIVKKMDNFERSEFSRLLRRWMIRFQRGDPEAKFVRDRTVESNEN